MSEPDEDEFEDCPADTVECRRCRGNAYIEPSDPNDPREEIECPECNGEGMVENG